MIGDREPGNDELLPAQYVPRAVVEAENRRLDEEDQRCWTHRPTRLNPDA